jgi:hypothetical protein
VSESVEARSRIRVPIVSRSIPTAASKKAHAVKCERLTGLAGGQLGVYSSSARSRRSTKRWSAGSVVMISARIETWLTAYR